jgi:ferritin-like metal-binding protein YciE
MSEQTASQAKLIQYLTEAHNKEKELETSLAAHIEMATRPPYKKRLKEHLKETRKHAKQTERRLKQLGGDFGLVAKAGEIAGRGVAAAKGPLHAVRGTGEEEKQLKNAKTEYSEEHEEIATYLAIEILATEVGDTETAKLAKSIRREEERMASFLEKQIPILTKAVAKAEIPASERNSGTRSRSRSGSTRRKPSAKAASSTRSSSSKRGASTRSTARSGSSKSGGTRKRSSRTKAAKS